MFKATTRKQTPATFKPCLEALEERCLLDANPTPIQAIEGLIFDGAGLAYALMTHQNTSGIQGNIAFDLPYAGPLGQMFSLLSFYDTLNSPLQASLIDTIVTTPTTIATMFGLPQFSNWIKSIEGILTTESNTGNFISGVEGDIGFILHPTQQGPNPNQQGPNPNQQGPTHSPIVGTFVGSAVPSGLKGNNLSFQTYQIALTINNDGSGSITIKPDPAGFSGTFTGQIQKNADGTYYLHGVEANGTNVEIEEARLVNGNQLYLNLDVYTGTSGNLVEDLSWDGTRGVPFYLTKQ